MQWCARAGFALVATADCVFTSVGHGGSLCTMEMDRSYKSGNFFLPGGVGGTSVYIIVIRSHRATDLGKT